MASLDLQDKLQALIRARAEIEAALAPDAHWLALRRVQARAIGSEESLHGRALEAALSADPLYRAWRHLSEAIAALQVEELYQSAPQAGEPADDLTRIRGVTPALARRLADLGVTGFADIAAWNAEDVRTMGQALGVGRAISRQNWIEQAALLAGYDPARAVAPPLSKRVDPEDEPVAEPQSRVEVDADADMDDLTVAEESAEAPVDDVPIAADLPEEIRALIRDGAAGADAGAHEEASPAPEEASLASALEQIEPEQASAPEREAEPEAPPLPPPSPEPATPVARRFEDTGEAKVTFIVREPRAASPDRRSERADGGTLSREPSDDGEDAPKPFAVVGGGGEEAEVTIVKSSSAAGGHGSDGDVRAARRFLEVTPDD